MTLNTTLLREVADRIELEDRFDIRTWASKRRDDGAESPVDWTDVLHDCGTTACIGGYVNAMAHRRDLSNWDAAAADLGLDADQSVRLFFVTPQDSIWRQNAAAWGIENADLSEPNDPWVDPAKITAPLAAKVLRLIADGEVTL